MLVKRIFFLHIPCLTRHLRTTYRLQEHFLETINEALRLYLGSTYIQANDSANALAGDLVIRQQTWESLDRHVLVGRQRGYGYYFTYSSPYSPLAMHTAEMNYVFGNMGPNENFSYNPPLSPATSGDMKMSEMIRSY